jgi:hypothetical protein
MEPTLDRIAPESFALEIMDRFLDNVLEKRLCESVVQLVPRPPASSHIVDGSAYGPENGPLDIIGFWMLFGFEPLPIEALPIAMSCAIGFC